MRRAGLTLALALAPLPGALGASHATPSYARVVHLDPQPEDGSSAALREQLRFLERQAFTTEPDGEPAWTITRGALRPAPSGSGVSVGRTASSRPNGKPRPVGIARTGALSARLVSAIELVLRRNGAATAKLSWRDPRGKRRSTSAFVRGSPAPQVVRFEPRTGWRGGVDELRLALDWGADTRIDLIEVRLIGAFQGAASTGSAAVDLGFVELGREHRRVWASLLGSALVERVAIPEGARFSGAVAHLGPVTLGASTPTAVLEVEPEGGPTVEVGRWQVPSFGRWQALTADLTPFSGREVTLRLRTTSRQEAGASSASGLSVWGEPALLVPEGGPKPKSVLLVTFDTTRSDCAGASAETPALASLAASGILFESAWSTSNATTSSHASILTGLHLPEHGAVTNSAALAEDVTTLAERFRAAGYQTGAAVSAKHIGLKAGFGQGFDRFVDAPRRASDGRNTVAPVIGWLESWTRAGPRPFFVWVHLFDPHAPYGAPDEFLRDFELRTGRSPPSQLADPPTIPLFDAGNPADRVWLRNTSSRQHVTYQYRLGVAYADHLLGRLLSTLSELGLEDSTIVAATADHGESLGEHDIWFRHTGIYEKTVHVPLVLRVPGGPRGVRVSGLASLIDLAPTLLSLCGLERPEALRGVDLLSLVDAEADPDRVVWFFHTGVRQLGMRTRSHHFITTLLSTAGGLAEVVDSRGRTRPSRRDIPAGTNFLFPIDEHGTTGPDLAAQEEELVAEFLQRAEAWQSTLETRAETKRDLTEQEREELRALGYLVE